MMQGRPSFADRLRDTALEALQNLRAQGRRSALALLGIVIGTASIIAMLNSGDMAQRESLKLFAKMGVDMLLVRAVPTGDRPPLLSGAMLADLPERDSAIAKVLPLATGRAKARIGGRSADADTIAAPPELARTAALPLAQGRHLVAAESCAGSAVIGDGLAQALSAPAAPVVPGSMLLLGDYGFTIVGILAPIAPETLDPVRYDTAVLTLPGCARRIIPGDGPNGALISLRPGADARSVAERLTAALASPGTSVTILDAQSILATMQAQKAVHSRLLTAIGAVSLLVGGIGVMNVMLMSVMERQREIGLRAATGATPDDIVALFLVEAGLLTLVGGAAGSALGAAVSFAIAAGSGWDFHIAPWTLALGPASAGAMGLVFGLYPALSASRLDPITVLRAD